MPYDMEKVRQLRNQGLSLADIQLAMNQQNPSEGFGNMPSTAVNPVTAQSASFDDVVDEPPKRFVPREIPPAIYPQNTDGIEDNPDGEYLGAENFESPQGTTSADAMALAGLPPQESEIQTTPNAGAFGYGGVEYEEPETYQPEYGPNQPLALQDQSASRQDNKLFDLGIEPVPDLGGEYQGKPLGSKVLPHQNELDYLQSPQAKQLAKNKALVERQKADFEGQKNLALQQRQAEQAEQMAAIAKQRDEEVQAEINTMRQEYDKYKNMEVKDFWQDKPTYLKIMAVVAAALGGYAQGLLGGRNNAMDIINKTMDDDYAKQKGMIAKQFEAYKMSKGNVDLVDDLFKRKMKSLDLKEIAKTEALKESIIKKMGQIKSNQGKVNGQEIVEALNYKTEKLKDNSMKALQNSINKKKSETKKGLTAWQEILYQEKIANKTVQNFGVAYNERQAKKLEEKVESALKIQRSVNHIMAVGRDISKIDFKRKAEINTNINMLVGNLRLPVVGPGPLTDEERKFLFSIIGNPTDLFSYENLEIHKLKTLKSIILKELDFNAMQAIPDYKPKHLSKREYADSLKAIGNPAESFGDYALRNGFSPQVTEKNLQQGKTNQPSKKLNPLRGRGKDGNIWLYDPVTKERLGKAN